MKSSTPTPPPSTIFPPTPLVWSRETFDEHTTLKRLYYILPSICTMIDVEKKTAGENLTRTQEKWELKRLILRLLKDERSLFIIIKFSASDNAFLAF